MNPRPLAFGPVRLAIWSAVAAILVAPLVAMQVTDAVAWTASDFAVAAALLVGACALFELVAWKTASARTRWALGLGLAAVVLVVWAEGAVGLFH